MISNKKINVLWIDDEIDRTEDARYIAQKTENLRIEVIHPIEEKMKDRLAQIKDKKNLQDLFLIDYFLDRKAMRPRGEKFESRALSLAGRIRELLPEYPIYVLSNKERDSEGIFASEAQAAKASFDKILTLRDVQRYGHRILYFDALDYRLIRNSERNKIDALFKLLKAPEEITDKLKLVLPDELQYGLSSPSRSKIPFGNAISFANWVRELILNIPGFLYDELYTATYLGMKREYFKNISSKFKKAVYSGVFASTSPNLWWVIEIKYYFQNLKLKEVKKPTLGKLLN
ncbi:MAG: hypothetical protein ACFFCW_09330 [Candidatus Hodarchaeota archaeon]